MTEILIHNARPEFELKRQTAGASGWDLSANIVAGLPSHDYWNIAPGERAVVGTGIHLAMPLGVEAQVRGRSGLAANHGVIGVPGTIDSDYRGEVMVTLINLGQVEFEVTPGMRIAQLVFAPVIFPVILPPEEGEEVGKRRPPVQTLIAWGRCDVRFVESLSDLPSTDRGASGFGSTGMGGGK